MKYLLSNSRAFTVSIKLYRTSVLLLFSGMLLLGCDSQSASTDNSETIVSSQTNIDSTVDTKTEDNQVEASTVDKSQDEPGSSLLESAKTDENPQKTRSPMIAEKRDDSALQATLIGDYIGMLPCSSCDGITLTLNLHSDGSIKKTSDYKNPQTAQPSLVENGIYRQDDNIITIVYDDEKIETYIIQDNHLVMMGDNNTPDDDYTLSRK